jgi:hypothetical protein
MSAAAARVNGPRRIGRPVCLAAPAAELAQVFDALLRTVECVS